MAIHLPLKQSLINEVTNKELFWILKVQPSLPGYKIEHSVNNENSKAENLQKINLNLPQKSIVCL